MGGSQILDCLIFLGQLKRNWELLSGLKGTGHPKSKLRENVVLSIYKLPIYQIFRKNYTPMCNNLSKIKILHIGAELQVMYLCQKYSE